MNDLANLFKENGSSPNLRVLDPQCFCEFYRTKIFEWGKWMAKDLEGGHTVCNRSSDLASMYHERQ